MDVRGKKQRMREQHRALSPQLYANDRFRMAWDFNRNACRTTRTILD